METQPRYQRRKYGCIISWFESRDTVVGTVIGFGLDDQGVGVRVPLGEKISLLMSFRPTLGPTQPPNQWVLGTNSLGAKRSGREADHSPPTSAEFKKTLICTPTSPYFYMA
jgi:hypothetical protein